MIVLLDTGALIPVWVDTEENLKKQFHFKFIKSDVAFKGFGGSVKGNLYNILFQFGSIIFPKMPIITCNTLGAPHFNMIISATVFQGLIYEINTITHKLNITIPDDNLVRNLHYIDDNNKTCVLSTIHTCNLF